MLRQFGRIIFLVCYSLGLALIMPLRLLARKLWVWRERWQINRRVLSATYIRSVFVSFILLGIITVGGFYTVQLIASGQRIKGQVLGQADTGLNYLTEAGQAIVANQDTTAASWQLEQALQSFERSRQDLNSNNLLIQNLLNLVPQKQDADRLLQASTLISEGGIALTKFYELSRTIKITPQGVTMASGQSNVLGAMNEQLALAQQKISEAAQLIVEVDPQIVPASKRPAFGQAKTLLLSTTASIQTLAEVFDILYRITTGEKKVLFLFQNHDELRPTGGFPGTFGRMNLKDGQIEELHISSIYDLDGQLNEIIAPPAPIRAVNPRWFLRDSNWFTDFPHSTRVITRLYEKEGGQTPDLIIALTPEVAIELLRLTGPIHLPRYNITFTPENFQDLAQYETSVNFDKFLNQPKQALADFFPVLLQRLGDLSGDGLMPLIAGLHKNFQAKHLLIYSRNPELQQRLEKFNWTGSLKPADRDYLLVSTANLGGTKSDIRMQQSIDLKSDIGVDGRVRNTLTITRRNLSPDVPAERNLSFLRAYVPLGSKLISATGFSEMDLPVISSDNPSSDPDAAAWAQGLVLDVTSGTLIGEEDGKTFFGNWSQVAGGGSQTMSLVYDLPFLLQETDRYSLLAQRQPGTVNQEFSYSLGFPTRAVEWKSFQAGRFEGEKLTLNQSLGRDYFLGLIFKRQ